MNKQQVIKLAETIFIQSGAFANLSAKLNFVTFINYPFKTSKVDDSTLLLSNLDSETLYIFDLAEPERYVRSLFASGVYPIPQFHHHWHPRGVVGTDAMASIFCAEDGYLTHQNKQLMFDKWGLLFDGNRNLYKEEELTKGQYNNQWEVYEEMLPARQLLEMLGIKKVKLVCDRQRVDLISCCTNAYDLMLEIEVIK